MDSHTYRDPRVDSYWTDEAKYSAWYRVELAVLRHKHPDLVAYLDAKPAYHAMPPVAEIRHREERLGHEMAAFLAALSDRLLPPAARWLHHGLTSSDTQDTALALTLQQVNRALWEMFCRIDLPNTPATGYTHGQLASPSNWRRRWRAARQAVHPPAVYYGCLSGATGGYPALTPDDEYHILRTLGLRPAVSLQVVPRSVLTVPSLRFWVDTMVACRQIAQDVRLGSAFGECSEPARLVGSSAMPGKVNPLESERICSLSEMVIAGCHQLEADTTRLWLERDLTNSAVEREQLPRLSSIAGYVLGRTRRLVEGLDLRRWGRRAPFGRECAEVLLVEYTEGTVTTYPEAHRRVTDAMEQGSMFRAAWLLGVDIGKVADRVVRMSRHAGRADWQVPQDPTRRVGVEKEHGDV